MSENGYGLSDKVVNAIKELGEKHGLERIILFGSRARGDFKKRSDIDIAVSGGNVEVFATDVEEYVPTLLKFDVINLDKPVQNELLCEIKKEGVVIYEKI